MVGKGVCHGANPRCGRCCGRGGLPMAAPLAAAAGQSRAGQALAIRRESRALRMGPARRALTLGARPAGLCHRSLHWAQPAPLHTPPALASPVQIAMKELREKKVPFTIRRYLPDGRCAPGPLPCPPLLPPAQPPWAHPCPPCRKERAGPLDLPLACCDPRVRDECPTPAQL
jgi:hypothetical protein